MSNEIHIVKEEKEKDRIIKKERSDKEGKNSISNKN